MTDLTGTSWLFNEIINLGSMLNPQPSSAMLYVNFISNNTEYQSLYSDSNDLYYDYNILATQINVYSALFQSWTNQAYRTIEITGGADATNTDLITWLQNNATQLQTLTPKEQYQAQLTELANAINEKTGGTSPMTVAEMATAVQSIQTGGAELNIAYGDTAPTDTSKLWIKGAEPSGLTVTQKLSGGSGDITMGIATLPTGAGYIGTAAVGAKIYLFGGGIVNPSLNTINEFDATNNTITTLSTTLPSNTSHIGTAAVGTKIYLFGGIQVSTLLNTIRVFDTTSNTISTLSATLPTAAYGIGTAAVGTKIYLFGGKGSTTYDYRNEIYVFDTTNNTITTLSATLPTGAQGIGTAAVGTKVYLFGGQSSTSAYLKTINVFDTTSNTITTLSTTLPTVAYGIGTAAVGTKIYLFGGYGSSRLNTINVFDTTSNTITTLSATLPTGAGDIGTAVVGTKIYLFGGSGINPLNTINKFSVAIDLTNNNIIVLTDSGDTKTFDLIAEPKVEINVKNVYRGDTDNTAQINEAYLYSGTAWVEVNG